MIHLIAFTKIDGKKVAYHFSSNEISDVLDKQESLANTPLFTKYSSAFSFHILKADGKSFDSVSNMDPYFKDTFVISNFSDFLKKIDDNNQVGAKSVASYLVRNFELKPFALEKVLYYIYAEWLRNKNSRLFQAKFIAYDAGPVDKNVYALNKHHRDELVKDTLFDCSLMNRDDRVAIIDTIKSNVNKYGDYYNQVWTNGNSKNPEFNLTHRKDTPWFIAKQLRGHNGLILDSDIINYHSNELIV
ncbi:MAG: hypothetical protein LKF37_05930 [Lentilactobacillus diolivorans]|jgi:uncharacterized phage-associated protein|nr:hypothetical protein [Lentilactobacillus diolivorans]RRG01319.1 MAG: hypothetical protein DUD34_12520 [Lactobacillus sp.]